MTRAENQNRIDEAMTERLRLKLNRHKELAAEPSELERELLAAQNADTLENAAMIIFRIRAGLDYSAQSHIDKVLFRERVRKGKSIR